MAENDEKGVSSLDFNIAPYYDDFNDNKKFVKTLFKPSVSVQARELTQLQSSLQNQIGSLADGMYKDGSVVVPGQMAFDNDYSYVKIQQSYNGSQVNPQDFVGRIIQGKITGLRAIVMYGAISTETEPDTLFIKYLDGGKEPAEVTSGNIPAELQSQLAVGDSESILNNYSGALGAETTFVKDELLIAVVESGEIPLVCRTIDSIDETVFASGKGSAAFIEEGIYFVRGFLVKVDTQFIILDKYSKTPSYRIGLEVIEDIVTSEDDDSLFDNARGSNNFNASGADRHRIQLLLTKREIDSIDDEDFLELLRLEDGEAVYQVRADANQVIEDTLARRTFDESGDYTVEPFSVDMRCFLEEDENRGIYEMSDFAFDNQIEAIDVAKSRFGLIDVDGQGTEHTPSLTDIDAYPEQNLDINKHYPGNTHDELVDKLRELMCVGVEEGKAYVRGYEIEKLGTEYLDYWKSRSHSFNLDSSIAANVGNYIFTSDLYSLPEVWDTIDLFDKNSDGAAGPLAISGSQKIGTARVKTIEHYSGDRINGFNTANQGSTTSAVWKLFLLDIDMNEGWSIDSARGWEVSRDSIGITSTGHGNILTQYFVINPETQLNGEGKHDIYSAFTYPGVSSVGTSYGYNSVRQELLVKHTTSSNLFSSGDSIVQDNNGTPIKTVIERKNQTIDSVNTYMLYPFPYTDIKTIKDGNDTPDVEFYIRKTISLVTNNDGYAELTLSTGEKFSHYTDTDYSACFVSGQSSSGVAIALSSSLLKTDGNAAQTKIIFNPSAETGYGNSEIKLTVTILKSGNVTTGSKERTKNLKKAAIAPYTNMDYSGLFLDPANVSSDVNSSDAFDPTTYPNGIALADAKPDLSYLTLDHCDIYDVKIYDTCDSSFGLTTTSGNGYQIDDEGSIVALHRITYDGAVYASEQYKLYVKDNAHVTPLLGEVPVPLKDITEQYVLDDGQRNGLYELGSLKLKSGNKGPAGRLLITYRYFEHGAGECFTVDSYTGEVKYEDIPSYDAINVSLSDVMDFRPTTSSSYDGTTVNIDSTRESRISAIFNRNEAGDLLTGTIKPNSVIRVDYQHYLNRIDKVYLTKEGELKIKYGTPAIAPDTPVDPDDGMVLYTLNAPAYTRDCDSIDADMQDNRRYTMRDIGKLESRIENVEYYTSLSMLEKETENMSLTDKSGLERFKNGFVVDSFTGHNVGDVEHEDYKCAVDAEEGLLRPEFNETNVPIEYNETESTGVVRVGDYLMLPYTHISFAKQEFASQYMNVNPFAIFSFNGDVNLYPSTDNWRDTKRAPALIVNRNGNYDSVRRKLSRSGTLGTVWNNWKTDWTGVSRTTTSKKNITFTSRTAGSHGIAAPAWWPHPWGRRGRGTIVTRKISTTTRSTRRGVRTRVVPYVTRQNVGDKVVNTTMIPFMRSREIMFVATGMKPNTKVFPVFDDKLVSAYCRPSAILVIEFTETNVILKKNHTLLTINNKARARIRAISRNEDGKYTAHVTVNKYLARKYGVTFQVGDVLKLEGTTSRIANVVSFTDVPAKGTDLMTDDKGAIVGLFRIPNTNALRFRTGKKEFKISDSANPRNLDTDTKAETTYTAKGIMVTKQATIVSTRHAKVVRESVSRNKTVSTTSRRQVSVELKGWYDPLAQTFMVNQKGGLFLTKIDLNFAKKDKNIPVSVQIRETVNGYPGKKILPGGEISLNPELVNVPENPDFDASIPTTFEFEEPIYLKELTEYCFVVMSNCQGYEMFVSHLGEKNIGTNRTISQQPYAGVFFKSQNASTWTADQYKDLKFNLYRAKFDTASAGSVVMNNGHFDENGNNLDLDFLDEDCFESTKGSDKIKIYHDNHGLLVGDTVTFQGIENRTYNNILHSFFIDSVSGASIEHIVSEVNSLDSYTILLDVDTNLLIADLDEISSGLFGIGDISASSNFSCDLLVPMIQELDLPGTSMEWRYRSTSGKSIHSNFTPYVPDSKFNSFIMNENITFDVPKLIASDENEINRMSGSDGSLDKKSLVIRCDMKSDSDNITPVIDLTRSSATCISNRTNSPIDGASTPAEGYVENFVSETDPDGGSSSSKYVLKEVELNDSAIGLSIIATVHRPDSADVDIFYKTKIAEDKRIINDLDWVPVERPSNYDNAAVSPDQYDEYKIEVNDLPEYTSFTLKIVMRSTNSATVPMIKDLRVIALGT